MMGKERRKSTTVCLAAAFLLTCHLVQTAESLRLTKTERRAARKEFDVGVQEGKILFGDVSEKDSHVTDGNWKASSNSSAEDETSYQADFAGWAQPEIDDAQKEKWNRMATSLHCFGDHLKFRSLGSGASQLEVEQENKQSMPLTMIPPKCGYKMHGNAMAFVMIVPYEGCNMIQQDDDYKLPLRWHGNPVSLLCPKRRRKAYNRRHHWPKYQLPLIPQHPQVPQYPKEPKFPQEPQYPQYPQFPQEPQYPQFPQEPQELQYPQIPQEPKYPPVLQDHQLPSFLQYHQMPQFPQEPKYPPLPQEPQVTQAPLDSQLKYLSYLYAHPLLSYFYSLGAEKADSSQFWKPVYPEQAFSSTPAATKPPTTSPSTSATTVTSYSQLPFDSSFMPFGHFVYDLPPYFPYPLPEYPQNPTSAVTTTAPTTSATPMPSGDTWDMPLFYQPERFLFSYGQEFPQLFYPFQG